MCWVFVLYACTRRGEKKTEKFPMKLWQEIEQQAPPGPRAAHSFDMLENRIIVFGGWNGKRALNDLHVFDYQAGVWQQCESMPDCPSTRNNHATAVVDNKLFIHGGHDGSRWLSDMYILTCNTSYQEDSMESRSFCESLTWTRAQTSGVHPAARACHTMSRIGRKIYLCGGYNGTSCFSAIEVLDLDTMTWIQPTVTGNVPIARNAHTMTVVGKVLYLFGGHSGSRHLNDLHVFDTSKLEWSTPVVTGSIPPGLRGHSSNLVGGNQIVLFGGYDGRNRANDLYLFDISTNKWTHPTETDGSPPGRQRHTACLVGSKKLLIYAGFNGSKWLADLYLLDVGKFEELALHDESNQLFVSNMSKLIDNPEFADIRIHVGEKVIHAHRAILACQCEKFAALLGSDMKESQEGNIFVQDWSYEPFFALITYIYTGRLPKQNCEMDELLGLADSYAFDSLKVLCERILINSLETSNCCYLLKVGDRYNARDLKKNALNYLLKSFDQVVSTDAFEELSSSPKLLMEVTKAAATNNGGMGGSGGFGM
jgi:leucine-zipper-like transcriptional regulator 1